MPITPAILGLEQLIRCIGRPTELYRQYSHLTSWLVSARRSSRCHQQRTRDAAWRWSSPASSVSSRSMFMAFRVSSKGTISTASGPSPAASTSSFVSTMTFPADATGRRDLLQYCEEKFVTQPQNQFEAGARSGTYEQRYFICGKQFFNKDNGTIFFYNGNEADVLLYLNNTGLMWENAEEFNALLVFAEQSYFGKSIPFGGDDVLDHMEFLSLTAALADFAVLIQNLKEELDVDVPVIEFGGSYGGVLAAWFRMKYPHLMDGAISASAPLLHYYNDPDHTTDTEASRRIVSYDMTEAADSRPVRTSTRSSWRL